MKVCDVCGDRGTHSTTIATYAMGTQVRFGLLDQTYRNLEVELCDKCNERVNKEIAMHMYEEFGLMIREERNDG